MTSSADDFEWMIICLFSIPIDVKFGDENWRDSNCKTLDSEAIAPTTEPFLKYGPSPASFPSYFRLSKQTLHFSTTNKWEKYPSSILCRDSNPRPSEHESPPIAHQPEPLLNVFSGVYIPNAAYEEVRILNQMKGSLLSTNFLFVLFTK